MKKQICLSLLTVYCISFSLSAQESYICFDPGSTMMGEHYKGKVKHIKKTICFSDSFRLQPPYESLLFVTGTKNSFNKAGNPTQEIFTYSVPGKGTVKYSYYKDGNRKRIKMSRKKPQPIVERVENFSRPVIENGIRKVICSINNLGEMRTDTLEWCDYEEDSFLPFPEDSVQKMLEQETIDDLSFRVDKANNGEHSVSRQYKIRKEKGIAYIEIECSESKGGMLRKYFIETAASFINERRETVDGRVYYTETKFDSHGNRVEQAEFSGEDKKTFEYKTVWEIKYYK